MSDEFTRNRALAFDTTKMMLEGVADIAALLYSIKFNREYITNAYETVHLIDHKLAGLKPIPTWIHECLTDKELVGCKIGKINPFGQKVNKDRCLNAFLNSSGLTTFDKAMFVRTVKQYINVIPTTIGHEGSGGHALAWPEHDEGLEQFNSKVGDSHKIEQGDIEAMYGNDDAAPADPPRPTSTDLFIDSLAESYVDRILAQTPDASPPEVIPEPDRKGKQPRVKPAPKPVRFLTPAELDGVWPGK